MTSTPSPTGPTYWAGAWPCPPCFLFPCMPCINSSVFQERSKRLVLEQLEHLLVITLEIEDVLCGCNASRGGFSGHVGSKRRTLFKTNPTAAS